MKKSFLNKIKFTIVSLFLLSTTSVIAAQLIPTDKYVPLEPNAFKGVPIDYGGPNALGDFLTAVFNWGIAVAVVLAFVMIVWGGVEYMTTDSWGGKDEGKKKIYEALQGLALALVSYLLLYTINPCIVVWKGGGCDNTFISVPKANNK